MISKSIHLIFGTIALTVIGTALVWGFIIVGSPETARSRRLDAERINELEKIHNAIQNLCVEWVEKKAKMKRDLPETLQKLAEQVSETDFYELDLLDPVTGDRYEYRVLNETEYELCAEFDNALDRKTDMFWNHPAGHHCFKFDALSPPAGDTSYRYR